MEGDELLTPRQVALKLQICTRTVRNHVRAGVLPQPVRLGGHLVRFRAAEIAAVLQSRGVAA